MILNVLALLLAASLASPAYPQGSLSARGQQLLTANCSGCHAIGRADKGAHPDAPPFRTLARKYPLEYLEESLAEGLSSGHPDMPEFVFEVEDIAAILAYLRSIQE